MESISNIFFVLLNHILFFTLATVIFIKKILPLIKNGKKSLLVENNRSCEKLALKRKELIDLQLSLAHNEQLLQKYDEHIKKWKSSLAKEKEDAKHAAIKNKISSRKKIIEQQEYSAAKNKIHQLQNSFAALLYDESIKETDKNSIRNLFLITKKNHDK